MTTAVPRRLLLVTLEFVPTFSGNGILAQTTAKALTARGVDVLVVHGVPEGSSGATAGLDIDGPGAFHRCSLPVTSQSWGRLDRHGPWEEFSQQCTSAAVLRHVQCFDATAWLAIDWTGHQASKRLLDALALPALPRRVYFCFRVFARSTELHATQTPASTIAATTPTASAAQDVPATDQYQPGEGGNSDQTFYTLQETAAVSHSDHAVFLSRSDLDFVLEHFAICSAQATKACSVLLPPLRQDVAALAERADAGPEEQPRRYLSCCVRLSPEKNAMLFADVVERLAADLAQLGIIPALCGDGGGAPEYAESVRKRVLAACPQALVHERFLDVGEFTQLAAQSVLNFHPALHDAYGMTIVEAAAMGTASVVSDSGAVGACELLQHGELIPAPLHDLDATATIVLHALREGRSNLATIAAKARQRARSWTATTFGNDLEHRLWPTHAHS